MRRKHRSRAHGEMGATTVTAQGLAKARSSRGKYTRARRHPQQRPTYSVADGRVTVGSVVPHGRNRWRAIAADGTDTGIFDNLQAAIRAVPFTRAKGKS